MVTNVRRIIFWVLLICVILIPLLLAAQSPLLAWRQPIYILAGFAGVIAMALLLVQPLLIGGYLPGLSVGQLRKGHRIVGSVLVLMVLVHVGALWITSPPDVIDALLFDSPTPFSLWGVIAMWAIFSAALLAAQRSSLRLRPQYWRRGHTALVVIAVAGSVAHALLIEGTMEQLSKIALCGLVVLVTLKVVYERRAWTGLIQRLRENRD